MAVDLGVGEEFAGHRIEAEIGRGGMGVVYLAEHLRLGRKVAIKVISPDLAREESFRRRFVRESRLAAALEHPNIVPVYDAGEAGDRAYISMRYVDGFDLARFLRDQGELPPHTAIGIVRQVAAGLDAAHRQGLVHRDVKPANILLERSGREPFPWRAFLSDFGVTKHLASSKTTETGQFIGTLDYMAPEQIAGGPMDGRTDEYSLACVTFECLTGGVPFGRNEQVGVMYAHLHEPPPAVSSRREGLTTRVDGVIQRAMAKAPEQRFGSCSEFVEAAARELGIELDGATSPGAAAGARTLRAVPDPGATPTVPSRGITFVPRGGRRRRRLAVLAILAVVVAAVGTTVAVLANHTTPLESTHSSPPVSPPASSAMSFPAGFAWERVPGSTAVFGGPEDGNQVMNRLKVHESRVTVVGMTSDTPDGESDGAVWASYDGVHWHRNALSSGGGPGPQNISAIGVLGDELVAVGSDSADPEDENAAVWTSRDGEHWNQDLDAPGALSGSGDQEIERIIRVGNELWAVGFDGPRGHHHAGVWRYDGKTWIKQTYDELALPEAGVEEMWSAAPFGEDIIAVGSDSSAGDTDAAVWLYHQAKHHEGWTREAQGSLRKPGYQLMRTVVAAGPGLVALGTDTSGGSHDAAAWTSTDGRHWTQVDPGQFTASGYQSVAAAIALDGGVIAVGTAGTLKDADAGVWLSPDGRHWTRSTDPALSGPGGQHMRGLALFRGRVVAVGSEEGADGGNAAVWIGRPILSEGTPSATPTAPATTRARVT